MLQLVADRFLRVSDHDAVDLATGQTVLLRVTPAETRREQLAWTANRASALDQHASPQLVDFGLVARNSRFEAFAVGGAMRASRRAEPAALRAMVNQTMDWLEQDTASASRILTIATCVHGWIGAVAREARL